MQSILSRLTQIKHNTDVALAKHPYIFHAALIVIVIAAGWLLYSIGIHTGLESLAAGLGFKPNPDNLIVPKVERPFLNIMTNTGKNTNIIFITHHFSRENCMEFYKKYKIYL